jgi:tRNA-splicing ligase RtcB
VLCADGHKGYAQPIGGVVAYRDHISISGVGFDIGCGNLALMTDADPDDVQKNIARIMQDVVSQISFGVGRVNDTPTDHHLFALDLWNREPWKSWRKLAQDQLGTVGSGNHFCDIFIDENRKVWVGVHFGSRGLGHKTATHFLKAAGGKDGMDVAPCTVGEHTELGQDYLAGMMLAGEYAYAGREYVARLVAQKILGATILTEIHNHHNYAWKERHLDEDYWVVRKGATPAFPEQLSFVGGSMGDDAVIIRGVDSDKSRDALYSTVHGAGRIMSRTAAKGKFTKVDGKKIRGVGLVRHDDMQKWLHDKAVHVVGGDVDEAPQAYRRLPEVLAAHQGTIGVVHTLRPIGVAMAGAGTVDPYKD